MGERDDRTGMIVGSVILVITAMIWGSAFVAQSTAMDHIGPYTMNGMRSLFAALFLFPTMFIADKIKGRKLRFFGTNDKKKIKTLLSGGLQLGILVTVASTIQQIGIQYTTVGKSGFLTTLYIVIVPLLGLFLKKKVNINGWIAIALALGGMYLLCVTGGFSMSKGDLLMIASAFFFAVHILVIDKYSPQADGIRLSFIQFVICAFVCLLLAAIYEKPVWADVKDAMFSIIWAGVVSAGIGYTLQIIGQRTVPTHIAPLIMSLESVFSVLAGMIFLHESMSGREIWGCVLIFIAVILAQIPFNKLLKRKKGNQESD